MRKSVLNPTFSTALGTPSFPLTSRRMSRATRPSFLAPTGFSPLSNGQKSLEKEKIDKPINNPDVRKNPDPKEILREILESNERLEADVYALYDAFKDLKFFRQFVSAMNHKEREDALLTVFKKVKYERWGPKTLIIRQGDYSDGKVYVLISGEANVYIDNSDGKDSKKPKSTSPTKESKDRDIMNVKPKNKTLVPGAVPSTAVRGSKLSRGSVFKTLVPVSPQDIRKSIRINTDLRSPKGEITPTTPRVVTEMVNYGNLIDQLQKGDYFGEKCLSYKQKRTATIMTEKESEFITLDKDLFQYIKTQFDKSKGEIIEFMRSSIPNLYEVDAALVLESLLYIADVKDFPYHKVLGTEGKPSDRIYLVYEGQCELMRTVIYDTTDSVGAMPDDTKSLYGLKKTKKEDIIITGVERGSFIGEEICFNHKNILEYTIRVSSEKAKIITFKKNKFMLRCPHLVLNALKLVLAIKKERNIQNLIEKLQKKGVNAKPEALEGFKPVVALPKPLKNVTNEVPKTPMSRNDNRVWPPAGSNIEIPSPKKINAIKTLSSRKFFPIRGINTEEAEEDSPITPLISYNSIASPRKLVTERDDSGSDSREEFKSPLITPRLLKKMERSSTLGDISGRDKSVTMKPSVPSIPSMTDSNIYGSINISRTVSQKEAFVSDISNFKMELRDHKDVERKYQVLKAHHAKLMVPDKDRMKAMTNSSLADFLTRRLIEGNIINEGPMTERIRVNSKVDDYGSLGVNKEMLKINLRMTGLNIDSNRKYSQEPKSASGLTPLSTTRVGFAGYPSSPASKALDNALNDLKSVVNIGQEVRHNEISRPTKPKAQTVVPKEVINIHVQHHASQTSRRGFFSRKGARTVKV